MKFEALATKTFNTANKDRLRFAGVDRAWKERFSPSTDDSAFENQLYERTKRIVPPNQHSLLPLKKVEMKAVVRALPEGERLLPSAQAHGMFADAKKGEFFIWDFQGCVYYEEKVHKHYEGRSSGTSVRVMKGVSVRVGQSQGRVVETTSLDQVDRGSLLITNKRLHFRGAHKAFKIFFSKLALAESYADGLKIIRDSASAKPQVFMFEDGWFLNEVLKRI